MSQKINSPLTGQPLYTAAQCRELDRVAIEDFQVPGYALMTRAGEACVAELDRRFPNIQRISVVCGAGNNAGDGYVIARLAKDQGMQVQCLWLVEPERLKGDALTAARDFLTAGGGATPFAEDTELTGQVIVDALLGTGLTREVGGAFARAVARVNASSGAVLSVDLPSGLSADSGSVQGCAVRADATVTFIGRKRGLYTGEALDHVGEVTFDDLAVPPAVYDQVPTDTTRVDAGLLKRLLSARPRNVHKGSHGAVLVVGGNHGMAGAARLAGEAALRSGAGLVRIATRQSHASLVTLARPELMTAAVEDAAALERAMGQASVVALGPGLGRSVWSQTVYEQALRFSGPMVIDADGLNLLAESPVCREDWVLTPHPGEAARLLGVGTRSIQADRFGAALKIAERYGGICVLKGAGTIIAQARPRPGFRVCATGNPGMATAGMGDVLTGVVAALMGQGLAPWPAATAAVVAHGRAGDLAAAGGERGLVAGDVIRRLRECVNP